MNANISADEWNDLMLELFRKFNVQVQVLDAADWLHPWKVTPNHDGVKWAARIHPGFINGQDPSVSLPVEDVPRETLDRLERNQQDVGITVDAWLTEDPALPLTSFRGIGADASPSGTSASSDGGISLTFEPVPPFFAALGVGSPPKIKEGIVGFETSTTADESTRLLRVTELVLYKDRPSTAANFQHNTDATGTVFQYDVITVGGFQRRISRAKIVNTASYSPPAPLDPLQRLLGNWVDDPRDSLHLATIFFVSPPGAPYGATPDQTWTPYVQHHVFWNLSHAANKLEPPLKNEALTLNTGLALGVGDRVNAFLLAQINDANSVISQFLNRNTIAGRFWTV